MFAYVSESLDEVGVTSEIKGVGECRLETRGTWNGKLFLEKMKPGSEEWQPVRLIASCNDRNVFLCFNEQKETLLRVRSFEWISGVCRIEMQFTDY